MSPPSKEARQRDHQANERTFLAWMRTSIALIGFGFAIARFGLFLRQLHLTLTQRPVGVDPLVNSEHLGVGLIGVGILTIALAAWRYSQIYWQIERGIYRPTRWFVWVMAAVVMALGTLSLPLIVGNRAALETPPAVHPSQRRVSP
ncbi:MAG TPA: DUF202 domain-containing protein [Stenomitos sp.]